ncbi:hypothetical protein BT93_A0185 [Corymbia citriodora subsp. variegata]|nr:hypothetical protein BT93_A0185 [Corymbia citriodora subsp. variegata]
MEFSFILVMWNKWNIRSFVILSLSLQIFLILFAPFRKKTVSQPIVFLLWLAYLMADWVAAFAIGLISHNQGISSAHAAKVDEALQAFWASFLLLHLGGPDTITTFSLEDSSLWRRHLLSIIFQVAAAIYVFLQIFPNDKLLAIPTMLVFLAGVIKNVERLLALVLSSLPRLREKMLKEMSSQHDFSDGAYDELIRELDALGNRYSNEEEAKLTESIVVKHAYYFHRIFKFFLGEIVFSCREREDAREYFLKISAVDALRVISVQLQFIYEVLHTKVVAIHSKRSYIFRFMAFTSVVMAFILFNRLKKHRFPKLDVEITYILLFGGIALDVIALFMLVFSDWIVAEIKWYNRGPTKLDSFSLKLPNTNVTYVALDTPFILRRWSESIPACNLLSESLKECPRKMYQGYQCWGIIVFSYICNFPFHVAEKIISCFHQAGETIIKGCGMRDTKLMIANTKYMSKNPFIKELWIFIFKEVKRKSESAGEELIEMKKIFEGRGDLFLKSSPEGIDCSNILQYVSDDTYDSTVLTWHFATEMWYIREKQSMNPTTRNDQREFSKILSDYMLYLFLNQANLVSAVANISQITSASMLRELEPIKNATNDVEELCDKLYKDHLGDLPPLSPLSSLSPLEKGIQLALKMESLREMKWKVMSGVWVEMLLYAAGHTKVEAHLQVPSKGGELLTFVWLLMVHFGFFNYVCDIPM